MRREADSHNPFLLGRRGFGCSTRPFFLSVIGVYFLFLVPLVGKGDSRAVSFFLIARSNDQWSPIFLTLTSCCVIASVGTLFINFSCTQNIISLPSLFVGPKDQPNLIIYQMWNSTTLFLAKSTTRPSTWDRLFGGRAREFLQTDRLTRLNQHSTA